MIFRLCMMYAIFLLFPVILPMFAVIKRTCRYCVLARFFIRSHLCCGSPSHTGTFGRGRGRSLEGDFLSLARFFIRGRLCCSSPSHTGTFGRGRGRSLEGDFLALDSILAFSIIYVCREFFYGGLAPDANPSHLSGPGTGSRLCNMGLEAGAYLCLTRLNLKASCFDNQRSTFCSGTTLRRASTPP